MEDVQGGNECGEAEAVSASLELIPLYRLLDRIYYKYPDFLKG